MPVNKSKIIYIMVTLGTSDQVTFSQVLQISGVLQVPGCTYKYLE